MKKTLLTIITVLLTMVGSYAISHSGDLDKWGCHTDHKDGTRHCHR